MSPNISNAEGTSSHVSQQKDTLHVAAMSLYEPLKRLSQNVHIYPQSLEQLLLKFPNPAMYFTSQEERSN
jgi:hypothetical protein